MDDMCTVLAQIDPNKLTKQKQKSEQNSEHWPDFTFQPPHLLLCLSQAFVEIADCEGRETKEHLDNVPLPQQQSIFKLWE